MISDRKPIKTPPAACPECSTVLTRSMSAAGPEAQPQPGTGTICAHCGAILEFTDGLQLTSASDATLIKIAGSRAMKNADTMIEILRRQRAAFSRSGQD